MTLNNINAELAAWLAASAGAITIITIIGNWWHNYMIRRYLRQIMHNTKRTTEWTSTNEEGKKKKP